MTDILTPKILDKILAIHNDYPTLRPTIIIQSALDLKRKTTNVDLHNISSKEFLTALTELHNKYKGV